MTDAELRLVAELGTAFHFRAAAPQAPAWLSAGFFAITGAPESPPPGWHWTDVIHADDRASFRDRWMRADADGARLDTEVRLTGADGAGHWYRMRAAPLEVVANGSAAPGWVGVAQDAREDAESSAQLTAEFLATASHELRTPLNVIAGWLHVLKLRAPGDLQQWHALAAIERNVQAEKTLVERLLDVSRLARGAVTIVPVPVDLVALARIGVASATPTAMAKGLVMHVDAPVAPVMVTADRGKIEQVVWHLLTNAIRSTGPFLPYVFEPFRKRPRVAARAGLGLGLTVVRALVELHGGSVSATSAGIGLGALFEVMLPCAA